MRAAAKLDRAAQEIGELGDHRLELAIESLVGGEAFAEPAELGRELATGVAGRFGLTLCLGMDGHGWLSGAHRLILDRPERRRDERGATMGAAAMVPRGGRFRKRRRGSDVSAEGFD